MREQLDALVSELRRLRRDGVGRVVVSDEALTSLRTLVSKVAAAAPAKPGVASAPSAPAAPVAPAQVREAAPVVREPVRIPVAPAAAAKVAAPAGEKPMPAAPDITLKPADAAGRLAELGTRLAADPVAAARPSGLTVFDGAPGAPVIFLIHMPGVDDAVEGRLLSGAEGDLYGKIVSAMGLPRASVMTASLVPYRPADDRDPVADEYAYFLPYFRALVETVKPRVIVALGGGAAEVLLGKSGPISKIRGVWSEWEGVPVMPTYHISYLIRNNTNKSKRIVWEDMLEVMARLRLPVSEKQRGYFLR